MKLNLPVIIIVVIAALVLIVFIVIRNRKDRRSLERKLNEDYRKPPEHGTGEGSSSSVD